MQCGAPNKEHAESSAGTARRVLDRARSPSLKEIGIDCARQFRGNSAADSPEELVRDADADALAKGVMR